MIDKSTIPEKIYLQFTDLDGYKFEKVEEMTWSYVRVNKDDVVFVKLRHKKRRRNENQR